MKNFDESYNRRDLEVTGEAEVIPFQPDRTSREQTAGHTLLPKDEVTGMREQWKDIQSRFVDNPKEAVQDADKLVNSCIDAIAEGFRNERGRLESQWSRGKDVSTEDLRLALQHYRDFLDHMLSV